MIAGLLSIYNTDLQAQLNGTVTVPGSYATIASAVQALNTQGVSTGGVIINVAAGHTETAPAGGIVLGSAVLNAGSASSSASRPVTIQKSGTGANPLITAFTPGTGTTDGIFKLVGSDYITIQGIDLRENTANTTTVQQMEWGYALLKRNNTAPFDGCQHVAIRDCNITMVKDSFKVVGIYAGNHISGNTTALTITSATDAHNDITISGNTIRNVMTGISLNGFNAATPYSLYDQNAVIDSNTIENFGVNVNIAVSGNPQTTSGIYLLYHNNAVIRGNKINNIAGGGAPNLRVSLHGIYHANATGAIAAITGNEITIICDSAGTIPVYYGIRSTITGGTTSGLTVTDNTITAVGGIGAANTTLIGHSGALLHLNISDNTFHDTWITSLNATFISSANNALANGTVRIRNNRITGHCIFSPKGTSFTSPNYIYGINSTGTADATVRDTVTGNHFYATYLAGPSNTLFFGINDAIGATSAPYPVKYISGNEISHIDSFGVTGINVSKAGHDGNNYSIVSHNKISNINSLIEGITVNNAAGQRLYIHDNTIDSSYNNSTGHTSGITNGILVLGGSEIRIYRNRIQELDARKSLSSAHSIRGIGINGGDTVIIYNNLIAGLHANNANNDTGIVGISLLGSNDARVYHNTVFISSGNTMPSFGAAGVLYGAGIGKLDLRNNIIHVDAEAGPDGIVSALRRTAGAAGVVPSNLDTNSNGNVYYTPDAANTYIYAEGIAPAAVVNEYGIGNDPAFNSGCGAYKAFMAPAESSSYTEDNLTATSDGLYAPAGSAYAKSLTVTTTDPAVTDDFNETARATPADAGALQFTGVPKAAGGVLTLNTDGSTDLCTGDSVLLRAPGISGANYTWTHNAQVVANGSDDTLFASESGDYQVVISYQGCTDTSEILTVTVFPLPEPVITENGGVLSTGTFSSYQWYRDGNTINGATNSTFTPGQGGSYTVKVTNNDGCENTSEARTVSVKQYLNKAISIYPNPVKDVLYIMNAAADLSVSITGIDGALLIRKENPGHIDVSSLPAGYYILSVADHKGQVLQREKLIKQ